MPDAKTTNIRLRNDLVPELKKRVGDEQHASLNSLVNELCRSYLVGERGPISPGLLSIADALGQSIGTGEIWLVVADEALAAPVTAAPYVQGYLGASYTTYVGIVRRYTATTVELSLGSGLYGTTCAIIARDDLKAWWKIQVCQRDVDEATFISEVVGRPETPDRCAVRRETSLFGRTSGLSGFELTLDEVISIEYARKQRLFDKHEAEAEIIGMGCIKTDVRHGRLREFASEWGLSDEEADKEHPDVFIVTGAELCSSSRANLLNFSIGGSPNLMPMRVRRGVPQDEPIPFGPEATRITKLRATPWLIYPNVYFATIEAEPEADVKISGLGVRVEYDSPLGQEIGYGEGWGTDRGPTEALRVAKIRV